MAAYYNEIDPYAAEWLRMLITFGHIADGVVDTRSISEIEPNDLREFTQCHFFAGIGVWSYALRLAGWPDDRPVWTGSCPCQPFSSAGRAAGFADERHLWPHWHHLIRECRPGVVFGEQVASKDGLGWLDLVHSDLEGEGYAVAPVDLCAAGFGAPHIRQRLYFVADTNSNGCDQARGSVATSKWDGSVGNGAACGLGDSNNKGLEGQRCGHTTESGRVGAAGSTAEAGESGGLADSGRALRERRPHTEGFAQTHQGQRHQGASDNQPCSGTGRLGHAGPTNGHWGNADWLFCRDGKWRPVEPGTFPLAHGAPARVGRLRAYGNAIVAQVAAQMIGAYMDVRGAQ